jgi:hypothetical protein
MSAWSSVPKTNLGAALQRFGVVALHWLKLLPSVALLAAGAALAVGGGGVLIKPDETLLQFLRQAAGAVAPVDLAWLVPSVAVVRGVALELLLAGLVVAGFGFLEICLWFVNGGSAAKVQSPARQRSRLALRALDMSGAAVVVAVIAFGLHRQAMKAEQTKTMNAEKEQIRVATELGQLMVLTQAAEEGKDPDALPRAIAYRHALKCEYGINCKKP